MAQQPSRSQQIAELYEHNDHRLRRRITYRAKAPAAIHANWQASSMRRRRGG
jgi:hypothetical protein